MPLSSPAYTLMRFDLSAIPAGAHITHVELDTTTRAGWAQDGDPAHWAIFIPDDTWSETGVTWETRPPDGLTSDTLGDPAYADGPDIRQSSLALGGADVWRNGCGADPDPAGNQTKTFPSTDDGFDRTVAQAETGFVDTVKANNVPGDDKLSLELWTPNCPMCPSGADKAYWARYYTREATDPAVRPKLVITYDTTIAGTVDITADAPTVAAGAAQVKLNAIPPSLFFNAAGALGPSPVGSIPVGSIPVGSIPVNSIPVGSIPVNSIGLAGTQTLLSSIALSTIPLSPPSVGPACSQARHSQACRCRT